MEKKQLDNKWKSRLLVGLQFGLLILVLVSGAAMPKQPLVWLIFCACCSIAAWAILAIPRQSFRISPIPSNRNELVTNGPYRFIRHPMYFSLILLSIGLCVNDPAPVRLIASVGLFELLRFKSRFEEQMLTEIHHHYAEYQQRTKRIIPFIY